METGFIALYRKVLKSFIWRMSSPEHKVIFITILLLANHKENEWLWQGRKFTCQPGQFVTSLEELAKTSGKDISVQNVRSALKNFEKWDFLTNQSTKTGRLITILNWHEYQDIKTKRGKEISKELTKSRQSANRKLTPNNNDNHDNHNNKGKEKIDKKEMPKSEYAEFVLLTESEYAALASKYGEQAVRAMIEILDNYKGANPKKRSYASDYRAILSWVASKYLDENRHIQAANSREAAHSRALTANGVLGEIDKLKRKYCQEAETGLEWT